MTMAFGRGRAQVALLFTSLAVLLLAGLLHRGMRTRVTDVTVMPTGSDGAPKSVTFPYLDMVAPTDRALEFAFHVQATALTPRSFVVVPDDHVESIAVNGE